MLIAEQKTPILQIIFMLSLVFVLALPATATPDTIGTVGTVSLASVGTQPGQGFAHNSKGPDDTNVPWRIRFLEAAVVNGPNVTLGEVAVPVGAMPAELWQEYARRELWVSPPEGKGGVNMTRPRLQEAVMATMRDLAPYCLFPGSLALQRGGMALDKSAIQQVVVKELTPYLATMPGENSLSDFRLPGVLFLRHSGQRVGVEEPRKITPGRLGLRLLVFEMDGKVVQKVTGSVFIDSWLEVPTAEAPLNREDLLTPENITFVRTNLAHLRSQVWDGRGGPWRVMRPIEVGQAIYQHDLATIPTVRKGNVVTVVYGGPRVNLTAQGEALSNGSIGETIAVRNTVSKKEIYAVIRDGVTVEVNSSMRQ